ncbi:2-amino-4-hydroxy-6-hydroxymethyldihydropteridine diphosphokinase [Novilysobacter defluvii]|uniref:2-amino-4-hydroxy-6-hydroxymethyldihydropteridine pyrophosphokinase n=1 Tax=Lysobacter defluvii IMMIB APB-9 = DSM 18482 TaxID=1385515 RepID=A0A0A0M9C8_9GAMM|nr:2-amino-4-hydroxy-6-hydroxymethyldihydropteridine diphosphokinase [Lysobacter defluvii]KGO99653.1 2-amino-4-hydroxy-6-hydroxymethyldihydropteridine pyrophosphokinase [Lysobacter defluvii IMMIB APB-9 = DSM 18482]
MTTTVDAVVGLGSNQGDSVARVRAALGALGRLPGTRVASASRLYRTPAWGVLDQPDFINAAARLRTTLGPVVLLEAMLGIEREAGRVRSPDGTDRWGPRVLDLDLLLFGDQRIDVPGLTVPHPHLHERAFALVPLLEAWPEAVIPGRGPAREALAGLATGAIEALPYADDPASPHAPRN